MVCAAAPSAQLIGPIARDVGVGGRGQIKTPIRIVGEATSDAADLLQLSGGTAGYVRTVRQCSIFPLISASRFFETEK